MRPIPSKRPSVKSGSAEASEAADRHERAKDYLSAAEVARLLNAAAAERAGLAGVHPHTLRHSCGFALADKGHDLRLIQDYLGHRDPKPRRAAASRGCGGEYRPSGEAGHGRDPCDAPGANG
jgi:Phage integrase family